jgi:hypothetical protein
MTERLVDLILECVTYCQYLKNEDISDEWDHITDEDFEHMKTIITTMLLD